MDGTTGRRDGAGTHFWLRHATQFMIGERSHTIEMEVPVPVGASAEERERLLREAEAGMNQLASRVENPTGQHNLPLPSATSSKPSAPSASAPLNKIASLPPAPATAGPLPTPAAPPTREATQALPSINKEVAIPPTGTPTRPHTGLSMPSTAVIPGDIGDSLKLPQFIQYIKDSMGLTPKQAMELLNVKTLSGLNYRDAIEQLQQGVSREVATMPLPELPVQSRNEPDARELEERSQAFSPAPILPPFASPNSKAPDIKELPHAVVRENPPAYFDEEDLDLDGEEEVEFLPELTVQERAIAENVLSRLKEARGSSGASPMRLTVLNNVVGDQLNEEQLQQIMQGVWGVPTSRKLKNEQVEALISWAKEDEFVSEAEIVLAVLQEEQYARSDR